jgi:predicted transcriptional regulator
MFTLGNPSSRERKTKKDSVAAVNIPLAEELQQQIAQFAREQNREPGEVLEDAVRRYIAVRKLERLAEKGEARARALDIQEENVPRLVEEVRRENRDVFRVKRA